MIDPLEGKFRDICNTLGVSFTEPERDPSDQATVDFYLPDFDLYVEVKAFHTDRINEQVARCCPKGCMVLVGMSAVLAFEKLLYAIKKRVK